MANNNRFDLEQNIMQCWNIVDDLQLLLEQGNVTEENVQAVATLYSRRFEYLWENFENCCQTNFESGVSVVDRSEEARNVFNEGLTTDDEKVDL